MSPRLTIVIPAFNEEELLPRCLQALQPQVEAHGGELLVVDNNSSDQTANIAKRYGARVITESRQGVVYALQRGLQAAGGEVVAFTDADTAVQPGWITACLTALQPSDVVAVTGPVQFERMRILTASRWLYRHQLLGSNMAVKRQVALAAGGFDMQYNLASDIAFGWAIREHGRIVYAPKMRVVTSSRRFQAQPFTTGIKYLLNHLWMLLFHTPLFWHFSNIRRSAAELNRQAAVRFWLWTVGFVLVVVAYLSWWPSASVFGLITVRGTNHVREVALTFNDGPNGSATRAMVDQLVNEKVPATFFVTGQAVTNDPATTAYIASHGFQLGNSSWDTSYDTALSSPSLIHREISHATEAIVSAAQQQPVYFRPPHGLRSPQLVFEVRRLGLHTVDWSVDGHDATSTDAQAIAQHVLRHVRAGSIIALRDGAGASTDPQVIDRRATLTALPLIVDGLRQRGYRIVSLDQLLQHEPEARHWYDVF